MAFRELYILQNKNGFIKIGTSNDTEKRLHTINKDYIDKFEIVTKFEIKHELTDLTETLIHQILNANLLNLKYLSENLNLIDIQEKIWNKEKEDWSDGSTELFLADKILIGNILFTLDKIGLLNLYKDDVEAIEKIKSFPIASFFETHKKEMKTILSVSGYRDMLEEADRIVKAPFNSKNIHEKNFSNIENKGIDNINIFFNKNEGFKLYINQKEMSPATWIFGNKNFNNIKKHLREGEENISYFSTTDFETFVKKISNNVIKIATQKSKKYKEYNIKNQKELTQKRQKEQKYKRKLNKMKREDEQIIKQNKLLIKDINRLMEEILLKKINLDSGHNGYFSIYTNETEPEIIQNCLRDNLTNLIEQNTHASEVKKTYSYDFNFIKFKDRPIETKLLYHYNERLNNSNFKNTFDNKNHAFYIQNILNILHIKPVNKHFFKKEGKMLYCPYKEKERIKNLNRKCLDIKLELENISNKLNNTKKNTHKLKR